MPSKPVLEVIQVQATHDGKDVRELDRSRKATMKGHDRAKAQQSKRSGKLAKAHLDQHVKGANKRSGLRFQDSDSSDGREDAGVDYAVKHAEDDSLTVFSGLTKSSMDVIEVPLLTIIRNPQPWTDGVGTDYELIPSPGDVIALDDDMEYDDDDWDEVNDFNVKADIGRNYAAALKNGLKAH